MLGLLEEGRLTMSAASMFYVLDKDDETSYFDLKSWGFWRGLILYFLLFSIVGHWMEVPYCWLMDSLFGIVAPDYAAFSDPLVVPYWVYGAGTVVLTLCLYPLKLHLIEKRKTLWGAALEFLLFAIVIAAVLETVFGLLINQPDANGVYPFWDNSTLPGNILGQGWIVNDINLGLVSLLYVWVIFPFLQKIMLSVNQRLANRFFIIVVVLIGIICVSWYLPQVLNDLGVLPSGYNHPNIN